MQFLANESLVREELVLQGRISLYTNNNPLNLREHIGMLMKFLDIRWSIWYSFDHGPFTALCANIETIHVCHIISRKGIERSISAKTSWCESSSFNPLTFFNSEVFLTSHAAKVPP